MITQMNVSKRFQERFTVDHESLIRFIDGLIGKPGVMRYAHKHQEMCVFLSVLKFHDVGIHKEKPYIEGSVLLLRENGLISPRRLLFKTLSSKILIKPRRHSHLIEINLL